jgi:lipopolysaccharide export system protein LptA
MTAAAGLLTTALISPVRGQSPAPAPGAQPDQSKLPYDVSAEHQELFNDEHRTVYSGNVEVVQGQDRLRTPRLTVFFAKKDSNAPSKKPAAPGAAGPGDTFGKIERMEAEGPVYFSNPTQNGRGDHGTYTAADDTTVLTGNVVLVQGKNVSTGDKLVMHQKTNQATLYSNTGKTRVRGVFYQDDQKPGTAPGAAGPASAPKPGGRS